MNGRYGIDKRTGAISLCQASVENMGKGNCPHLVHQLPDESLDCFMDRNNSLFTEINGVIQLNPAKSNEAFLKNHNQKAYFDATNVLKDHSSVAVVQATGTGKSAILSAVLDDYSDKSCVLISPQISINEQFYNHNKNCQVVVSDNLTTITYADIVVSCKEDKFKKYEHLRGQISLIMLDELHRSGAEKWGDAVEKFIEFTMKDEDSKIVGASATPKRQDGFDPTERFCGGRKVSNISLEEAIERKILRMPTYVGVPDWKDDSFGILYENAVNKNEQLRPSEKQQCAAFLMQKFAKHNVEKEFDTAFKTHFSNKLEEDDKKGIGTKVLVFCPDIAASQEFQKNLSEKLLNLYPNRTSNISCFHSKSDKKEKEFFKRFTNKNESVKSGEIEVIVSVGMFNEGIHAPGVETIIMSRGTESDIIYSQQLGRVMSTDSDAGDPLIFDLAQNHVKGEYKWEAIDNKVNKILGTNKKHVFTENGQEFYDDLRECQAYVSFFKPRGRHSSGTYEGKERFLKDIFIEKKVSEYKRREIKNAIIDGMSFDEAFKVYL